MSLATSLVMESTRKISRVQSITSSKDLEIKKTELPPELPFKDELTITKVKRLRRSRREVIVIDQFENEIADNFSPQKVLSSRKLSLDYASSQNQKIFSSRTASVRVTMIFFRSQQAEKV